MLSGAILPAGGKWREISMSMLLAGLGVGVAEINICQLVFSSVSAPGVEGCLGGKWHYGWREAPEEEQLR